MSQLSEKRVVCIEKLSKAISDYFVTLMPLMWIKLNEAREVIYGQCQAAFDCLSVCSTHTCPAYTESSRGPEPAWYCLLCKKRLLCLQRRHLMLFQLK